MVTAYWKGGGDSGPKLQAVLPLVWELVRPRRGLLAVGFVLMAINRVASLVLPYSTRYLIDSVIIKRNIQLLTQLVLGVLLATVIQGITSFALTQLLSKAAQRLIAELRQKVQAHIGRLSVAFHDSTKSGVLLSRIMNDVEGVRNLIGTGLVDLVGGLLTASIALVVLFRISALMTVLAFGFLLCFGVALKKAFQTIRPIFRERGKINAEVTGRLTESLGGVRVIKGSWGDGHRDDRGHRQWSRVPQGPRVCGVAGRCSPRTLDWWQAKAVKYREAGQLLLAKVVHTRCPCRAATKNETVFWIEHVTSATERAHAFQYRRNGFGQEAGPHGLGRAGKKRMLSPSRVLCATA